MFLAHCWWVWFMAWNCFTNTFQKSLWEKWIGKMFAEPWPLKKWMGTVALTVKLTYTERPQSDVKQAVGVKSLNAQALNTTSPKSPTDWDETEKLCRTDSRKWRCETQVLNYTSTGTVYLSGLAHFKQWPQVWFFIASGMKNSFLCMQQWTILRSRAVCRSLPNASWGSFCWAAHRKHCKSCYRSKCQWMFMRK